MYGISHSARNTEYKLFFLKNSIAEFFRKIYLLNKFSSADIITIRINRNNQRKVQNFEAINSFSSEFFK